MLHYEDRGQAAGKMVLSNIRVPECQINMEIIHISLLLSLLQVTYFSEDEIQGQRS